MFQKKDVIFNENLGVCRVEDIVKLSPNKTNVYNYYVLRPVYDKEKKAYIPVEHHATLLRELITVGEAQKLTGVKKVAFVKCAGTCDKANSDYL